MEPDAEATRSRSSESPAQESTSTPREDVGSPSHAVGEKPPAASIVGAPFGYPVDTNISPTEIASSAPPTSSTSSDSRVLGYEGDNFPSLLEAPGINESYEYGTVGHGD